jgi:hypothetical protein
MRRVRRVLLGSDQESARTAAALGVVVGLAAWTLRRLAGVSYWWWPTLPADWTFVACFVLLAAGVAYDRAGVLAACWVTFPAHVVYAHHFYASHSGFLVLPLQHDVFSVLASVPFAVLYGTVGYFLGATSRRAAARLQFVGAGTTD